MYHPLTSHGCERGQRTGKGVGEGKGDGRGRERKEGGEGEKGENMVVLDMDLNMLVFYHTDLNSEPTSKLCKWLY